ncbi:hypothetical protein [Streptosporangium sp. KLBMP 9127]|nr:hypothetical protein [Streptosporangium sp. KLBMP 9127]
MSDALLHYSTTTSPAPLEAGRPDKPASARIDLTVSAPAGPNIYCERILVAVPISDPDGGGAYFTEQPHAEIIGGPWSAPSAQMKSGQELGLAAATNYYYIPFEAPPVPGLDLVDKPLQFRITGTLAATTGSGLTCLVTETSGMSSGTYTRKDTFELALPTAEPVFYLNNFLANDPDKLTIPRTKFNAGDAVNFTWESNGSYFQLYDGDGTPLYEGPGTVYTLPKDKIVNDTTFTLQASVTSGTQQSTDVQPVYQYATLTITVSNPTLTGLTVNGLLSAKNDLTVSGSGYGEKITTVGANGLIVQNDCSVVKDLSSASLNTRGDIDCAGGLLVKGDLACDDLDTRGDINCQKGLSVDGESKLNGDVTLGDQVSHHSITVNGDVTIQEDLAVEGYCTVNKLLHAKNDLAVAGDGAEKISTRGTDGLYVDGTLTHYGDIIRG